jgi:hypothetical protein
MTEELLEKILYDCPICDQIHYVKKWQCDTKAFVEGNIVQYQEVIFRCMVSDDEDNEFVSGGMMIENLTRAQEAFNKKSGKIQEQ